MKTTLQGIGVLALGMATLAVLLGILLMAVGIALGTPVVGSTFAHR